MNFTKKSLVLVAFSLVTIMFSQEKPEVKIGGALRLNYNLSSLINSSVFSLELLSASTILVVFLN